MTALLPAAPTGTKRWFMIALFLGSLGLSARAQDYNAWQDYSINPIYDPGSRAGYPTVLMDTGGFGVPGGPNYTMWYGTGGSGLYVTTSADGLSWVTPPTLATGLYSPDHAKVLYDPQAFGVIGGPRYKIWYWDATQTTLYSIQAIRYAESPNGVAWVDDQTLTQDATHPLITGAGSGWNRGSYGPVFLFYQPGAANSGTNPWAYKYVMYFDGTTGGQESIGLGYSADGKYWVAASPNPALDHSSSSADWDSNFATFGTVLRDAAGFHLWYSGGQNGTNEGIGYATSPDGVVWTKSPANPIYHVSPAAPAYRMGGVYTPDVIRAGDWLLRMYYSGSPSGGSELRICLAANASVPVTNIPAAGTAGWLALVALLAVLGAWFVAHRRAL